MSFQCTGRLDRSLERLVVILVSTMPLCSVEPTVDRCECAAVNSGLRRGRLDIITTLITLPSLHCAAALSETGDACPSTSGQLSYDILYLGAGLGMFVVCRAVAPTRLVVHSFMLQRREADKEEADVEGVWPVVANVHQVVVFEC